MLFEKWATDSVISDVDVTLGWMDRIRVLLRGNLTVRVTVETENLVGKTHGRSRVEIPRIFPRHPSEMQAEYVPQPSRS